MRQRSFLQAEAGGVAHRHANDTPLCKPGACTVCPEHETTNITGATSISSCDCMPGYFRTNSGAAAWSMHVSQIWAVSRVLGIAGLL